MRLQAIAFSTEIRFRSEIVSACDTANKQACQMTFAALVRIKLHSSSMAHGLLG